MTKYSIKEESGKMLTLMRYGEPATNPFPTNAEVQFWLEAEELRAEKKKLEDQNNELRSVIATTCDLVNNWCREEGVNECRFPYKGLTLREAIDSLWCKISVKYVRKV